jgi:uncharacterized protein YciI
MKNILFPFGVLLLLLSCSSRTQEEKEDAPASDSGILYDSTLARETGADEYGMKHYVMAFLKAGPRRDQDSTTAAAIQKAHMANIHRLAQNGQLVVAGPFEDDGELRGVFIFNVTSLDDAKALTESDPAVQAGRLVMELHPWYGSAALMKINSLHRTLTRKSF